MKLGMQKPFRDVLVIQPERGNKVYEVYWIEPTYLGKLVREHSHRVVTEDGQVFKNLAAASAWLATQPRNQAASVRKITGLELIEAGKWLAFREMRGMAPAADASEYSKVFILSDDESRRLGL